MGKQWKTKQLSYFNNYMIRLKHIMHLTKRIITLFCPAINTYSPIGP